MCPVWNTPQPPLRIYGNTYYVGPQGLGSILITSPAGHILIDGALADSAAQIARNIAALGFRLQDVKIILNSHVHHDHAGGIAELQRLSGARVLASPWSAQVLTATGVGKDDPQFGLNRSIATIPKTHLETLTDNQVITVGPLNLTAHFTPGHTPGGTSFTWRSCAAGERGACHSLVYADSITPVSNATFRFTDHPEVLASFEKSYAFLDNAPCDILITPHPDALTPDLFDRIRAHVDRQAPDTLIDPTACHRLADYGRAQLQKRLTTEAAPATPPIK
jgi:metallo-beta-lactamase class B